MTQATFVVRGIHCQSCERRTRTLLGEVDGVEQVNADRCAGTVTVTFDEQRISRDGVVRELAGIGCVPRQQRPWAM